MVDMLRATWPLWVLLASIGLGKLLLAIRQQRRLARSRISEIDLMDGPTFERYLQTLFQRAAITWSTSAPLEATTAAT